MFYFIGRFLKHSSSLFLPCKQCLKISSHFLVFTAAICKLACLLGVGKVCNAVRMHWSTSASNTPTDLCKGIHSRLGCFVSREQQSCFPLTW